jgi:hypothetical protein
MPTVNYQVRITTELRNRLDEVSARWALKTGDFVRHVLAEAVAQDGGRPPATAEEVRREPVAAGGQ